MCIRTCYQLYADVIELYINNNYHLIIYIVSVVHRYGKNRTATRR